MRLTINNVNTALADAGIAAELVKGNGYFWFDREEAAEWYTASVGVAKLSHIDTVEGWVERYKTMRAEQ